MKTAVDMNDLRMGRLVLAVALPAVAGLAALIGLAPQGYLLIPLLLLLPSSAALSDGGNGAPFCRAMHRTALLANRHFTPYPRGTP